MIFKGLEVISGKAQVRLASIKHSDTEFDFCSFPLQRQVPRSHSWALSPQNRSAHHPLCQSFTANPHRAPVKRKDFSLKPRRCAEGKGEELGRKRKK